MKILHLTDTHLGHERKVLGAPPGWSRADDHREAMAAAVRWAEGVDLVIHTGDLFDRSRPSPAAAAAAAELLGALASRAPTLIIPGNHDRRGLRRSLPPRIEGLHIAEDAERIDFFGLRIGLIPWCADTESFGAAARRIEDGGIDLLACHQAPDGGWEHRYRFRRGVDRGTVGEPELPQGVELILGGHLHPRQVVRVGGRPWICTGSTERTSFREATQAKGVTLLEWNRRWTWRFENLPTRPLARVRCEEDLGVAVPGTLVQVHADNQEYSDRLVEAVIQRGAYVTRPAPMRTEQSATSVQRRLFEDR